jgi:hypothetical protein
MTDRAGREDFLAFFRKNDHHTDLELPAWSVE